MKTITIKLLLLGVVLSTTLTGCFNVDAEFKSMRNDVLENIDGDFKRDIEFGIGSAGITLASSFIALSDTDENVDDLLRQMSSIQIGVYQNRSHRGELNLHSSMLKNFSENMQINGWEFIVRTVDRDEMSMVFVKSDDEDNFSDLFVVSLDDDELVMAKLTGDLNEAINIAIRENGLKFHMAKN